jgi:hypothetical protein
VQKSPGKQFDVQQEPLKELPEATNEINIIGERHAGKL